MKSATLLAALVLMGCAPTPYWLDTASPSRSAEQMHADWENCIDPQMAELLDPPVQYYREAAARMMRCMAERGWKPSNPRELESLINP
jgi:hypothetical protein